MKQSDIELLLIDLSARVPYSPYISINDKKGFLLGVDCNILLGYEPTVIVGFDGEVKGVYTTITSVKPYLRSVSDMTSSEQEEFTKLRNFSKHFAYELIDFYNSHHIDYRGLLDLDLAIRAPEGMYKFE